MTTREFFAQVAAEHGIDRRSCPHAWVTVRDDRAYNGCTKCGWVVRKDAGDPEAIIAPGR